jgi:hypothetical protein
MGRTAMTVVGTVTGRVYRFAGPGSTVAIDTRDAASMIAVPNLRRA